MRWLFLSAQDIRAVTVGWGKDTALIKEETIPAAPEDYLNKINGFLVKERLSLKDFQSIIVVRGPGSFTSSRVITVIANTLAFALQLRVYGLINEKRLSAVELLKEFNPTKNQITLFVVPEYDRAPHITWPQKT